MMEVFATILIIFIFWFVPAAILSLCVKKIFKRKMSKGWCISVFIVSAFCSYSMLLLLNAHWHKFGVIWQFAAYAVVFVTVKNILYDPKQISIFDTEDEIKHKNEDSKHIS